QFLGSVGADLRPHQAALESLLEDDSLDQDVIASLYSQGRSSKALSRLLECMKGAGGESVWAWSFVTASGPAPQEVVDYVRAELRRSVALHRVRVAACLWAIESSVKGRVRTCDPRQKALSALIEALNDRFPLVRSEAAAALARIGPEGG